MRFTFALLLCRPSGCFLLLSAAKVTTIALRAVVFRGAGFLQGNGDRYYRANQLGLLTAIMPASEVLARASEAAQKLARKPATALRACKGLLKQPDREQLKQSVARETEEFAERVRSAEAKEAISAFFEKRAPDFARTKAGQPALKAS